VVPIRCGNIDLDYVLDGIPLSIRCLQRSDFQHLEVKCAGKWWRGVDDINDRPVGNPKRR
jgi:hypothetical protein